MYLLDNEKNKYTWNPKWIHPYESAWNISEKLFAANVSANTYNKLIGTKINGTRLNYHPDILAFSKGTLDTNFLRPYIKNDVDALHCFDDLSFFFLPYIKYCPECAKYGYHSIFHQLSFLDECLIHNQKLINLCECESSAALKWKKPVHSTFACTECGSQIPYPEISECIANKWENIALNIHVNISEEIANIYGIDNYVAYPHTGQLTEEQCNVLKLILSGKPVSELPNSYFKDNCNILPEKELIFLSKSIQDYMIKIYGREQCEEQFYLLKRYRHNNTYYKFNYDIIAGYYLIGELLAETYLDRIYPVKFACLSAEYDFNRNNVLNASNKLLYKINSKKISSVYMDRKNNKTYEIINYIYKQYAIIRYNEIRLALNTSHIDDYPLDATCIPLGSICDYPAYIIIKLNDGTMLLY